MMVPSKSLLCTGLALLGFAMTANAQNKEALDSSSFKRITPVKHMVYDFANRKVVRNGTPQKRAIATFCYINTDTVGFFTSTTLGTEFIDWGILGGTAGTQCLGLSPIVSNFNFAYASSTQDTSVGGPGAALTLTFYTSWQGFGADSGNCPVATFAFSGLPGFSGSSTGIGSAYAFTVDVSGGGEFCMPDGQFGYGYRGDGNTGPLLCLTGDGAGGLEPATGNQDVFDIWVPDTKGVNLGSFFFGGPPQNFSSWYGQVARADLTSSPAATATRNGAGNKPNSIMCSGGQLAGSLHVTVLANPGYIAAFLFGFCNPFSVTLGGGQTLLCLDLCGLGELLTGGGRAMTPAGTVGGCPQFTWWTALPKNLDFCGFSFCIQGITAFGTTPFGLTSACDITLGG
jgi:hypothetical protein